MGIFSAIMDKLRGRANEQVAQGQSQGAQQRPASAAGGHASPAQSASPPPAQSSTTPSAAATSAQTLQGVDIDAVLSHLAKQKGGGGNYRESIVDLLKLLDLDSSLAARKELAEELNVHAGEHGSAEQNIALHKAVIRRLADNGGKVADSTRS